MEEALDKAEHNVVIYSQALIACVPAVGQMIPSPNTTSIVIFLDFFHYGFRFPHSSFLLEVLTFYGTELIHFNPNSIVMLSVFAYLCEAFLGMHQSLALQVFLPPKGVPGQGDRPRRESHR